MWQTGTLRATGTALWVPPGTHVKFSTVQGTLSSGLVRLGVFHVPPCLAYVCLHVQSSTPLDPAFNLLLVVLVDPQVASVLSADARVCHY